MKFFCFEKKADLFFDSPKSGKKRNSIKNFCRFRLFFCSTGRAGHNFDCNSSPPKPDSLKTEFSQLIAKKENVSACRPAASGQIDGRTEPQTRFDLLHEPAVKGDSSFKTCLCRSQSFQRPSKKEIKFSFWKLLDYGRPVRSTLT